MERKKRGLSSTAAIALLLSALALAVWGIGMYCLTAMTAEFAADRFLDANVNRAHVINDRLLNVPDYSDTRQNFWRNLMWEQVSTGVFHYSGSYTAMEEGGFLDRRSESESYYATAFLDADGMVLAKSWADYIHFEFLTEAQWANRGERSANSAIAFFDRSKITPEGQPLIEHNGRSGNAEALRFTGWFDGVELIPAKIEFVDDDVFREALHAQGSGSYTVSGVIQDHGLPWITAYEDPDAVTNGGDYVIFYSDWFHLSCYAPSPAVSHLGTEYDSLAAMLKTLGPEYASGQQTRGSQWFDDTDLILLDVDYLTQIQGERTSLNSHPSVCEFDPGTTVETLHAVVTAVMFSPWRTAFGELRNIYLFTFAMMAVLTAIAVALLRDYLIKPLRQVNDGFATTRDNYYHTPDDPSPWREPRELFDHYERAQQERIRDRTELARLRTALDYAQEAEASRRQMTSNIAHELKTPLAVIHSYAEGLKERIAEDKRDKYLDVILAETHRTDAMVLEMLDLSRLEAGRVKLTKEPFCLTRLTMSVFERLEMAARGKELDIQYNLPEECMVTADESRIVQVVENFASNAVKYTPAGGAVRVRITAGYFGTTFTVENDSPPLTDEQLERVWDTFYRADQARSGGGTGLGLAIAKSIIDLHGGKCTVRNTKSGVAFSFTL